MPEVDVMGLIVALLVIWIALSILGFVVKGLVWLAIIGLVLFLATAAFGFVRRKSAGR
jgi:LPXTG-motif cell wall-anchored protein